MLLPYIFGAVLLGAAAAAPPDSVEPSGQDAAGAGTYEEEIEVRGREDDLVGLAGSSSEGITGRADLERRPTLRPGELVETVPGVIATQHSGGGKANQYFLRGFNLDHGTDFSVRVDGVPVNMPSHGHGQGYADLNFLIPEVVESVSFRKGPYSAEHGDFSSAGGADLALAESFGDNSGRLELEGGSFDFGRLLWMDSREAGGGRRAAALELFHQDGPWRRGDDFHGGKAYLRYSFGDAARGIAFTALGYDASWLATDQVPRRAIEAGLIDRFGLLDSGPRGDTERYSLSLRGYRTGDTTFDEWQVYALSYDFHLVSQFTYFLDDPVNGDQFEQADDRHVYGGSLSRRWNGSWQDKPVDLAAGLQLRYDDIANGLFRTRNLERIRTVRQDDIGQLGGGPWAEATIAWSPSFRTRLGLRADGYSARVDSDLAANSGSEKDLMLSPKVALVFGPWNKTELYLNLGAGHHSNDARGAVIRLDPSTLEAVPRVDPLVRSEGIDVGIRSTSLAGLHTTLTLFQLDLDSELLFVGDGGSTEASRPSRRRGVEWTNFWRLPGGFSADFDLTVTDAEFRDDDKAGKEIPGAVERTIAAGVAWQGEKASAALRWRYFGGAALIEDGSLEASSTSLVNAEIGYSISPRLRLDLEVFNLLDREGSDIEYFYASRLPTEPEEGVEDIHLHPLEKRSARFSLAWRY
jgi:hypothetical protein